MLSGSIDLRWRCWRRSTTSSAPLRRRVIDRELIAAAQHPSHPEHQKFVRSLTQSLNQESSLDLDVVNDLVAKCSLSIFGKDLPPREASSYLDG